MRERRRKENIKKRKYVGEVTEDGNKRKKRKKMLGNTKQGKIMRWEKKIMQNRIG